MTEKKRAPRLVALLVAASAACGGAKPVEAPPETPEPSASAPAAPPPPAAAATPSALSPSPPASSTPAPRRFGLKATTAMPIAGQFDTKAMLGEINGQIDEASRCADIIRQDDSVVGSLNVELTVVRGRVTPDLQSPTNERGRICLLTAMSSWRLATVGSGKSMLLLTFVDAGAGPP